jgi:hypothetical protein
MIFTLILCVINERNLVPTLRNVLNAVKRLNLIVLRGPAHQSPFVSVGFNRSLNGQ